jgi:hypothetical protein
MKKSLEVIDIETWDISIPVHIQNKALQALEEGKILYFPSLSFSLHDDENSFLSPQKLDPTTKNISYDIRNQRLGGFVGSNEDMQKLKEMIKRYALISCKFLEKLIPYYQANLIQARTSFRPAEISGRKSSYRKDDTLLHVDAFPSNPTKGNRILRIFTNINPHEKPRVWRVGEPFENVVRNFLPKAAYPFFGTSYLLRLLKITKDYRTLYDHYMLQIHDRMKGDNHYQKTVSYEEILFSAGSSWIVYTDQVSHAAMSGQHVLEQTFHLAPHNLKTPSTSPLKVLEKFLNQNLIKRY